MELTAEFDDFLAQYRAESLPKQITSVLLDYFVVAGNSNLTSNFSLSQTIDHILESSKLSNEVEVEEVGSKKEENLMLQNGPGMLGTFEDICALPTIVQKPKSIVNNLEDLPSQLTECDDYFDQYFSDGCGCSKECHRLFPKQVVLQAHLDALAMDRFCKDHVNHQHLLLMGAMNALVKNCEQKKSAKEKKAFSSYRTTSPKSKKPRINARTFFRFRGQDVCRHFFLYVFGCGVRRIKNVQKQFLSHGIVPKQHESAFSVKRLIKLDSNQQRLNALRFIANYAEQNGLQLPGRFTMTIKSNIIKHCDVYILPNQLNLSRRNIYELYLAGCEERSQEPISFALWNELWTLKYPNIMTVNNHGEICYECRQYRDYLFHPPTTSNNEQSPTLISAKSSSSSSITSKLAQTYRYLAHLNLIQSEIGHYRLSLEKSARHYQQLISKSPHSIQDGGSGGGIPHDLRNRFLSVLDSMHYTLDWYSTISLPFGPNNSANNSSSYFNSGYKVALFGISIEPIQKFVLYLIPEFVCHSSQSLPNLTCSILEHFFDNFHFNEKESVIHFANSSGEQAKQSLLFSYFTWRTLIGNHDKVEISFLPSGHSHCWNDLFMGAFKRSLRNCPINSLQDIKSISERCTLSDLTESNESRNSLIQPILVGNDQMELLMPLYDWNAMFVADNLMDQLDTKVLAENNHFEINIEIPGFILCRKSIESEIVSYRLVSNENLPRIDQNRPEKLNLEEIPLERMEYLRENILPYFMGKNNSIETIPTIFAHVWLSGEGNSGKRPRDSADPSSSISKKKIPKINPNNNTKSSPAQPKCGYCKEVGHRETIFGKIRCPKKKRDSSILDNCPLISEDNPMGNLISETEYQIEKINDDTLCIVEEALMSTESTANTSRTITFDANGQLSIITSHDEVGGSGVRVELAGEDVEVNFDEASNYFHQDCNQSSTEQTLIQTVDDISINPGNFNEISVEEGVEELVPEEEDVEQQQQVEHLSQESSTSPYHLLVMPDIDL